MVVHLILTHIKGIRIMNTPTILEAAEEPNSIEAKWEECFEATLENKNLSIKDIETAKFLFFSGVKALFELIEEMRPASSATKHIIAAGYAIDQIKLEVSSYLGEDEDTDVWVTVSGKEEEENGKESL